MMQNDDLKWIRRWNLASKFRFKLIAFLVSKSTQFLLATTVTMKIIFFSHLYCKKAQRFLPFKFHFIFASVFFWFTYENDIFFADSVCGRTRKKIVFHSLVVVVISRRLKNKMKYRHEKKRNNERTHLSGRNIKKNEKNLLHKMYFSLLGFQLF